MGSVSFSFIPPFWSLFQNPWAPAGTVGGGAAEPHLAAPSLTEGRKGAAGAASMLYCFPPGTLFLLERPKWYSGEKERAEGSWGGVAISLGFCPWPQHTHPPPSAPHSSLTYPPESSRKSSGGGGETGVGKKGTRNLNRSPPRGTEWEASGP